MKKIPEIRFPEFSGEWVEKKLREIFNFKVGGDIDKKHLSFKKDNIFKYPVYANSLENDGIYGYSNIFKIDKESITVTGRGNIGKAKYRKAYYYPIVRLIVLLPKQDVDLKFCKNAINKINILNESTGVPQLTAPQLKTYKIHIPLTLAEQQKIAEFLSKIDEKIEIVTKKIDELKQYKKGLLQKMLNVTDKGEPELRFKEFIGKWVEKRLGEVGEFFNGKSYESYIVENGSYNLITLNSITLEGKLSSTHKKVNVSNNFLRKNDLVIIMSDVAKGDFLGKIAIIPANNQYVLNQRVGGIRIKKDYNYSFIAYYINNKQKYFKKIGQGSSQKNISTNDIKNFKLYLPLTFKEQQKIANFLSSIDEKIELNENKLKALKKFKQGLVQKIFV